MIVIAFIAVFMGYYQTQVRWKKYRVLAEYHAYLESVYSDALEELPPWIKRNYDLDALGPEAPPLSPHSSKAHTKMGLKILMKYHQKMKNYWSSKW